LEKRKFTKIRVPLNGEQGGFNLPPGKFKWERKKLKGEKE